MFKPFIRCHTYVCISSFFNAHRPMVLMYAVLQLIASTAIILPRTYVSTIYLRYHSKITSCVLAFNLVVKYVSQSSNLLQFPHRFVYFHTLCSKIVLEQNMNKHDVVMEWYHKQQVCQPSVYNVCNKNSQNVAKVRQASK